MKWKISGVTGDRHEFLIAAVSSSDDLGVMRTVKASKSLHYEIAKTVQI
jgi:hypothetical protein